MKSSLISSSTACFVVEVEEGEFRLLFNEVEEDDDDPAPISLELKTSLKIFFFDIHIEARRRNLHNARTTSRRSPALNLDRPAIVINKESSLETLFEFPPSLLLLLLFDEDDEEEDEARRITAAEASSSIQVGG